MIGTKNSQARSAAWFVGVFFGFLSGVGGLIHGIGEIRQGNVGTGGLVFDSWADGPIARNLGGEPGLSIVPNVLITGILCVVVAVAVSVWAAGFLRTRRDAKVLIALEVLMLLFGGGVGPPLIGGLAGVAALRLPEVPSILSRASGPGWRQKIGSAWPWIFGLSVINGLYLFVGSVAVAYALDTPIDDLTLWSFALALLLMLLNIVGCSAYDRQKANN